MKKGLVMEGGAMRGMFTAGVCDVLLENGINFDGAIGVSAGATFGCNFKSDRKSTRLNSSHEQAIRPQLAILLFPLTFTHRRPLRSRFLLQAAPKQARPL